MIFKLCLLGSKKNKIVQDIICILYIANKPSYSTDCKITQQITKYLSAARAKLICPTHMSHTLTRICVTDIHRWRIIRFAVANQSSRIMWCQQFANLSIASGVCAFAVETECVTMCANDRFCARILLFACSEYGPVFNRINGY